MVKTESETLTLHAFGKIVKQLCNQPEGSEVTRDALLDAPVMENLFVNSNKVIVGIKK